MAVVTTLILVALVFMAIVGTIVWPTDSLAKRRDRVEITEAVLVERFRRDGFPQDVAERLARRIKEGR